MTPGGRLGAAIEVLDAVIAAARDNGPAADTILASYFRSRRYAGAKDRRAVRELVYRAVRLCGERPASGRAAMLAVAERQPELLALFGDGPHAPAPAGADEPRAAAGVGPAWLVEALGESGIDAEAQAALLGRAPLDVRANRLRTTRAALLAELDGAAALPLDPDALRLPEGAAVEGLAAFAEGRAEVQDAGSQLVARAAGAMAGMRVVDLCAGAGGKTLALAAHMDNDGEILACDVDRARLSRLAPRAARAGVTIAATRLLDPEREGAALAGRAEAVDLVLIDAPCSGTGTWRRNPEARWRLTPGRLDRLAATQARLLEVGAALVRPGGALTYIVCSLLDREGAEPIAAFLARRPDWHAEPLEIAAGAPHGDGVRLHPAASDTDGFFVARLRRP